MNNIGTWFWIPLLAVLTETPAQTSVLGTVQATLNGQQRTWFVVQGTSRGGPYTSALWMDVGENRVVTVGGFDTDDPPIDTFEYELDSGPVSFGDYAGSAINILLTIPAGAEAVHTDLTADNVTASVVFMPVATTDISTAYFATDGTVDASAIRFEGGVLAISGSFSARLAPMAGGDVIEISNGTFELAGVPSRDSTERP